MKVMLKKGRFRQIYLTEFDDLYRYALALSGDPETALETVQEAFFRLCRNGFGASAVRQPRRWLFRVVRNLVIDGQRLQRRFSSLEETPLLDPGSPETHFEKRRSGERVVAALATLPERQRDCITLREFGDLSYREIAGVLEISIDQVKVQLYRARQALRNQLEEWQ